MTLTERIVERSIEKAIKKMSKTIKSDGLEGLVLISVGAFGTVNILSVLTEKIFDSVKYYLLKDPTIFHHNYKNYVKHPDDKDLKTMIPPKGIYIVRMSFNQNNIVSYDGIDWEGAGVCSVIVFDEEYDNILDSLMEEID